MTLFVPCAGPILGLILTGAALGLALLVGGRVFAAMKGSLAATELVRRGLGVFVLPNEYGRAVALALLALFGLALLFPQLAGRITRPVVALRAPAKVPISIPTGSGP
jgi:hypothetical protein